ncbi:amidohydrolase family protein [Pseudoduganella violacea]|uniref:Putative TIM-barrel fold metal-dependent hydrolase n=1 Tax=Pseudoduganella violacea TaxID=1715466 RepID=A0A7W5BE40_9BURK|nr:amidohydrolase family protein [Pseudoduganella violacea]MBB3121210.1 putative TIM-barrel fold metal-dependent hydrolase [Pseudoduganella violacea]
MPASTPQFSSRRRRLLRLMAAGAALPWLPACGPLPLQQGAPPLLAGDLLVDVHCHAFNAADLPVRGFIQHVALHDDEDQIVFAGMERALLPWLAALLIEFIGSAAKSARAELEEIDSGAAGATKAANGQRIEDELVRALLAVFGTPSLGLKNLRPQDLPEDEQGRNALLRAIRSETGGDKSLPGILDEAEARATARSLLSGIGVIARYIRWGATLLLDRRDIVARLLGLYTPPNAKALFTPALVDLSLWLDDEPQSDLESQIRVMERIQRLQTTAALHCFVPLDPWRQLIDVSARQRRTALDLVRWAVEEMGFVGVKLYPPMGFLPAENSRFNLSYPERAGDNPLFPLYLDHALDQLYRYAAAAGIPIMAHAADSNGAASGYSGRAAPRFWQPVLKAYPGLRLNLGHFGGFEHSLMQPPAEDWEEMVGQLGAAWPDDHVFADLSYLSELLPGRDAAKAQHVRRQMAGFLARHDPELRHLMYGSDWVMLGKEKDHERYTETISTQLAALGLDTARSKRFLAGNALRFLGLHQGQPGRQRLEDYHRRHQLDASWLQRVDQYRAS